MKIGIDLGGSHIAMGVISNENEIIDKYEVDIDLKENVKQFIENTIVDKIKYFSKKYDIKEIGFAVPGIVKNQKISNLFNLGIGEYDIISNINTKLDNPILKAIPKKISNDGVCAAIAEVKFGNLRQYSNSIFLCLGTGIGGAVCENGNVIASNDKIGFEFGHMQVKAGGNLCKCGKYGCFETYGSMKKLKSDIKQILKLSENCQGEYLHNSILQNIDNSDVQKIINNYIKELVYGISQIANITNPQAICLGGGFSYYKDILFNKFVIEFSKEEFLKIEHTPQITIAKFNNDAGIIGAVN